MKKKSFLYFIILITILIYLFFETKTAMNAVKEGGILFFTGILPSLFPFLVLSNIFFKLDYAKYLSKICAPFMTKFFKISGRGAYPIITSIISGYPIGSKTVSEMYLNNQISHNEANKLISICSTPGPIFVIGTVATLFLNFPKASLIILPSIYLSLFLYAYIFFKDGKYIPMKKERPTYKKHYNIGKIFSDSINNSMDTLINILGYIMFFSLIINILDTTILSTLDILPFKSNMFLSNFIKGMIEMTIGIKGLSELNFISAPIMIAIITFLLSFGGICVNMQCISFISNTDLNIPRYLLSKLYLGVISGGISYILSSVFLKGTVLTFNIGLKMPFTFTLTLTALFAVIYIFTIITLMILIKKEI